VHGFRRLITIALTAGTLSGLVWFGLQYFTVIPLIETAEKYETAATHDHEDHDHESARPTGQIPSRL
jgi:predicted cobalt transporter CbtA